MVTLDITSTKKKDLFESLFTHIKQSDPRLYETLLRLMRRPMIDFSTLITESIFKYFYMQKPAINDVTSSGNFILDSVNDTSIWIPEIAMINDRNPASGALTVDIQVSHGSNIFQSILSSSAPFGLPSGSRGPVIYKEFDPTAFFKFNDLFRGQLLTSSVSGGRTDADDIEFTLLVKRKQ